MLLKRGNGCRRTTTQRVEWAMKENKPSTVSEPSESSEAIVAESLLDFRSIVAACPDGIVSTCLGTLVRTWNRGAEKLFGYSREEALGKKLDSLIIAAGDDKGRGVLGSVLSNREQSACKDINCLTKSGESVVVQANAAHATGRPSRLSLTFPARYAQPGGRAPALAAPGRV